MNSIFLLTTLAIFLLISAKGVTGIKCYYCVSNYLVPNSDCEMGKTSGMKSIDCSPQIKYCSVNKVENYATTGNTVNWVAVTRDCSLNSDSQGLPGKWQICQSDLCNTGSRLSTLSLSSGLLILLAPVFYMRSGF